MKNVIYNSEIIGTFDNLIFVPNKNFKKIAKSVLKLDKKTFYHVKISKQPIDNEYFAYNCIKHNVDDHTILFRLFSKIITAK